MGLLVTIVDKSEVHVGSTISILLAGEIGKLEDTVAWSIPHTLIKLACRMSRMLALELWTQS